MGERNKVSLHYIQPGKPMQNAYIERKNGSMRRELLNVWMFGSLNDARSKAEEWRVDYNPERPHKALNYLSPVAYAKKQQLVNGIEAEVCSAALSTNPRRPDSPKAVRDV